MNIRTFPQPRVPVPALLWLALTVAMSPVHAQEIAQMDIDGTNAFVDDARQRPSAVDVPIRDGSMVRTGPRTSARVELAPQGIVLLNENSAKLISTSFFKGTRCLAVRLIAGELFINGSNICFLTNVGAVSGISRSRINLKVDERGTVMTVIQGAADLDGKLASMRVTTSEQLVVWPNGEHKTTLLDATAAERTADWTRNYFTAPPKKALKGWQKALIGLGVIAVGAAAYDASKDDDDDRRDPPAPPPPPAGGTDYPTPMDDAAPTPPPTPASTTRSPASAPAASRLQRQHALELQLPTCCVPFSGGGEQTIRTTPADCAERGGRLSGACSTPVR
ncbi:hypothetical protein ACFOLC_11280 [Lysobacter cavernae]|uniref:FecR protein domain-containing protein n=1 Tax=Lysobacter cavernae TaxID=1685901 RepID=A0ABV7RQF2_9GAMM